MIQNFIFIYFIFAVASTIGTARRRYERLRGEVDLDEIEFEHET